MSRSFMRLLSASALGLSTFASFAQNIDFTGTSSDGQSVLGHVFVNSSATASLSETWADGTLHNRFLLYPNGVFGIMGGWRVDVGGPGAFGAYDEGYEHGADLGPQVDEYLSPDGHSSLTLDWTLYPDCHGGCTNQATLHLDMRSDTASLFGSSIDANVFKRYTSGGGKVTSLVQYLGPDETVYSSQSSFTLSAVPEPQALVMALGGLVAVAGALRRRCRT